MDAPAWVAPPGERRGDFDEIDVDRARQEDAAAKHREEADTERYLTEAARALASSLGPTTRAKRLARREIRAVLLAVWNESRRCAALHQSLGVQLRTQEEIDAYRADQR